MNLDKILRRLLIAFVIYLAVIVLLALLAVFFQAWYYVNVFDLIEKYLPAVLSVFE